MADLLKRGAPPSGAKFSLPHWRFSPVSSTSFARSMDLRSLVSGGSGISDAFSGWDSAGCSGR